MAEKVVHALAFAHLAPVIAIAHLVKVGLQVLLAYPMMYAVNLPFEQAPCAFDAVHMAEVMPHVFAGAVVDPEMPIVRLEAGIACMLVRIEGRARLDVLLNLLADRFGFQIIHNGNADLTAALQKAEDRNLAGAALLAARALAGMLVGFLAADEAFVHLDLTL